MNLNKYDAEGYLYTPEEAAERAAAIFMPVYLHKGYPANPVLGANGLPVPSAKVLPYNVGRNAAKRAARQIRGIRK